MILDILFQARRHSSSEVCNPTRWSIP